MSRVKKEDKIIQIREDVSSDTIFNLLFITPSDPTIGIQLANLFNPPQGISQEKIQQILKKNGGDFTFMIQVASSYKEALSLIARNNIFVIESLNSQYSNRIHGIAFELSSNNEEEKNLWDWEKFLDTLISSWGLARCRLLYGFIALVNEQEINDPYVLAKLLRYGVRCLISTPVNPDEVEVKLIDFCKDIYGRSGRFSLETNELETEEGYIQVTEILRYKGPDGNNTGITLPKYKKIISKQGKILYQNET
ncbi:hypothetical protein PCC7424_5851 (plasmid) [Gloeothece citriformis PCC 7424]|uniref:Uncharacterized protein n=1 Tax=Gloeothece citriformis (strain PCC 7424) TaxID=65393 RepID=B7KM83_GLOC7|nr:hypothetical protein [Gloeothece citriformis]ACK73905.1 hypothetical protein PCC7424_5851 [Gloeothece citriformis PCC 7424]